MKIHALRMLALGTALVACRLDVTIPDAGFAAFSTEMTDAGTVEAPASCSTKQFAVCSEAQIAAFVIAINRSVIDAAMLAQEITMSADVRGFADRMVHDHSAAQASFQALFAKLQISPLDNDNSLQFAASAARDITDLRTRSGSDFDRTYIAAAALEHVMLLGLLDNIFISGAKTPSLKQALIDMRGVVVMHLDHALTVQKAIVGACGSPPATTHDAGPPPASDGGPGMTESEGGTGMADPP